MAFFCVSFIYLFFSIFGPSVLHPVLSLHCFEMCCFATQGIFPFVNPNLCKDCAQHLICVTVFISNWTKIGFDDHRRVFKSFLNPCHWFWRELSKTPRSMFTLGYVVSLSAPQSPQNKIPLCLLSWNSFYDPRLTLVTRLFLLSPEPMGSVLFYLGKNLPRTFYFSGVSLFFF